jgi:hypothetical protein
VAAPMPREPLLTSATRPNPWLNAAPFLGRTTHCHARPP